MPWNLDGRESPLDHLVSSLEAVCVYWNLGSIKERVRLDKRNYRSLRIEGDPGPLPIPLFVQKDHISISNSLVSKAATIAIRRRVELNKQIPILNEFTVCPMLFHTIQYIHVLLRQGNWQVYLVHHCWSFFPSAK